MRTPILTLIHNGLGRGSRQKPTSVELRVTYMRKQKFISTGVKINTAQWNCISLILVDYLKVLNLLKVASVIAIR